MVVADTGTRQARPIPPGIDQSRCQGNLSTAGQTKTPSPWGALDQGGNVVAWQDTIAPAQEGFSLPRVWRRLHGGVANAPPANVHLRLRVPAPSSAPRWRQSLVWFRVGDIRNVK